MLQNLNARVHNCLARAEEYGQRAKIEADPELARDYLEMERGWLTLARSYQFGESLSDFIAAAPKPGGLDEELHKISTLLIQEGSLDALYDRILNAAIVLMSSDMASMQLVDPERNQLRLLAWKGFHPQSAAFWEWVHFHSGTTCGLALSAGGRVVGARH
jgi:hypothetical protein